MSSSRAIVVLGMHRNGTSLVTRGLQALDIYLGEDFLKTRPDNPTGYWENRFIQKLNERVLGSFGMRWETAGLIDDEQWNIANLDAFRREAIDYLQAHFLDRPLWGFKDPQTILLLPFWRSVFNELGVDDRYVVTSRNPLSVAESLRARQDTPGPDAHLLWLLYMVPNFLRVAERPCVVVDYDRLMEDPAGQFARVAERLEIPLAEKQRTAVEEFARTFLQPDLRHHQFSPADFESEIPGLAPTSREAYLRLSHLATDEVAPDSDRFRAAWKNLTDRTIRLAVPILERKKQERELRSRTREASNLYVFAQRRNFPEVRLFVVTGTQRTGTNLLREVLNTNPNIAMVAEVLTPCPAPGKYAEPQPKSRQLDEDTPAAFQLPGTVPAPRLPGLNFLGHWGNFLRTIPADAFPVKSPAEAEALLDRFFDHLLRTIRGDWVGSDKKNVKAVGVDIKYSHLHRLAPPHWNPELPPFLLGYLRARGATLIHGSRRNIIQCAISGFVSDQTGKFHNYGGKTMTSSFYLEVKDLLVRTRRIVDEREKFSRSSPDFALVDYEYDDLSREVARGDFETGVIPDQPGPLSTIAGALDVPFEFRNPRRLKKSINIPYRKLLTNYDEVVKAIAESEFAEFARTLE